jgi:hypothetical protein
MWLHACPELRATPELQRAPDHTTLYRFESRWLSPQWVSGVLAELRRHRGLTQRRVDVAWDSTGLQVHGASAYFATRHGGRRFRRYIKPSTAVGREAMVAATVIADRGASCDKKQLPQLFDETVARLRVRHWLADAGYDSEPLHAARRQRGIASWIPPGANAPTAATAATGARAWPRDCPSVMGNAGKRRVFSADSSAWSATAWRRDAPSGN